MLARIRKSAEEKDQGFTLIELLVVIIIIGILAAIAIPVFLNQRKKAVEAGMKSDLRTYANEVETFYTDNQLYPAAATGTGTAGIPVTGSSPAVTVKISDPVTTLTYTLDAGLESYCIVATSTKTDNDWAYDSDGGGVKKGSVC